MIRRARRGTRAAVVVLALQIAAIPGLAQVSAIDGPAPIVGPMPDIELPPAASDRAMLRKYIWSTLGVNGAIHATWSSGLDHWQESPPAWTKSASGYARRWTSKYAESAIGDAAKYTVARAFHHDPSFRKCECSGFARRLRHALDSPFTARTRDGRRVFSAASLAGFLAGHVVASSTWYPAPNGARDGVKHAGTSLVKTIGIDVLKEFWRRGDGK